MTTRLQLPEPIRFEFSNNSVRRTTVQIDSLGIFYSVTRKDGIISVRRWDQRTDTEILIGQINWRFMRRSLVRFGEAEQWGYISKFLRREHGFILSPARTFTGSNRTEYRWCMPWNKLMLCPPDGDTKNPLAIYHRHRKSSEKSYIEIFDRSLLETLDLVLISFLIVEKRRRDD